MEVAEFTENRKLHLTARHKQNFIYKEKNITQVWDQESSFARISDHRQMIRTGASDGSRSIQSTIAIRDHSFT